MSNLKNHIVFVREKCRVMGHPLRKRIQEVQVPQNSSCSTLLMQRKGEIKAAAFAGFGFEPDSVAMINDKYCLPR
jgi:hypothetical protein